MNADAEGVDDDADDDKGGNVAFLVFVPPTWYFHGFWTFQLIGSLDPLDKQSALFNVDSLDAFSLGLLHFVSTMQKEEGCCSYKYTIDWSLY
jgi:hypothetical protein